MKNIIIKAIERVLIWVGIIEVVEDPFVVEMRKAGLL
jgi:hypothetical protein